MTEDDRKAAWARGRPAPGWTVLTEEVPGVEKGDRWFIWRFGEGKLWHGATKGDGESWAAEIKVVIDDIEWCEP